MKPKIEIVTNILSTALLLMLMAFQIVGDTLREWYGAHFKGKYKPLRISGDVLNFAVPK